MQENLGSSQNHWLLGLRVADQFDLDHALDGLLFCYRANRDFQGTLFACDLHRGVVTGDKDDLRGGECLGQEGLSWKAQGGWPFQW